MTWRFRPLTAVLAGSSTATALLVVWLWPQAGTVESPAVLLDACRTDEKDAAAINAAMNARHDAEEEALRRRLLDAFDALAAADARAMQAAKLLTCGEDLVKAEWQRESCEKHLTARIQWCPCATVEDERQEDPDEGHGAGDD